MIDDTSYDASWTHDDRKARNKRRTRKINLNISVFRKKMSFGATLQERSSKNRTSGVASAGSGLPMVLLAVGRLVLSEVRASRPSARLVAHSWPSRILPSGVVHVSDIRLEQRGRRGFASSPLAAGLIPSFQWSRPKSPPMDDTILSETKERTISTEPELLPPTPSIAEEPLISPINVDDGPVGEIIASQAASASSTVQHYIKAFDGSLVSSGSLDLSGISTGLHIHPIMRMQSLMLKFHESFPLLDHGLPWYILIPTLTVFLRIGLFYFQVKSQRNNAKMAIIQPELIKSMDSLKEAKKRGDVVGAQQAQFESQDLMQKNNVNPLKGIVFPLAQGATFMTAFFAIRGLSNAGLPSMTTEGFGWVQDLTAADPYMVLPIASSLLTVAMIELGFATNKAAATSTSTNMKFIFRGVCLATPFLVMYFPAAVLMFWVSNNTISLAQTLLLQQSGVKRVFNIPEAPRKPQEGEPGYVQEPGFMEAFNTMKDSLRDMSREAQEKADKELLRRKVAKAHEETAENERRQRLLNMSRQRSEVRLSGGPPSTNLESNQYPASTAQSNSITGKTPVDYKPKKLPQFDKDLQERLRKAGYNNVK